MTHPFLFGLFVVGPLMAILMLNIATLAIVLERTRRPQ